MGSGGFFFTYFAAGIFGCIESNLYISSLCLPSYSRNVLGGNFALVGLPSIGASGAIFGTVAVC